MGLPSRNRIGHAINSAVRGIFRIVIIQRALEEGLAFLQAFGHGDPDDPENQELLQEADIDHVQHFGFSSSPPVDTEAIVADVDGGLVSLGERDSLEDLDTHGSADEMPELATGDTCIYSRDGTYISLDADGKLTIKAMTDNIEIITEAGKQIKLGQTMGSTQDIAYAGGDYASASKVASGPPLDAWTHNVFADIAALKIDATNIDALLAAAGTLVANVVAINGYLNALPNPIGGAPPPAPALGPPGSKVPTTLVPNTIDGIDEDNDHSYVSSGSTKAEVEP